MRIRRVALLLAGAALLPSRLAESQQIGLAVGYVRMPGRIGDSKSDQGIAGRLGVYLGTSSRIGLGLEAGVDRLNQSFTESSHPSCLLPGGGVGPCYFKRWARDVGLSINAIAKIQTRVGKAWPYVLAGLGAMSVRSQERSEARDGSGNRLPNFEIDASHTDGAILGHIGAGVAVSTGGGRFAVTLEGRTTAMLHNYSGGLQMNMSPSVVVGVRW